MRNLEALVAMAVMLAALAGCGGAATTSGPETKPAFGRVFPAAAGLVVAEYDAQGGVLQLSTPTGSEGEFRFERSLTGKRVAAGSALNEHRVPDTWGALTTNPQWVELNPLTLLQDQLLASSGTIVEVNASLVQLIGAACGAQAGASAQAALVNTNSETKAPDWMLRSVASYVRALNDIGVEAGPGWKDKLTQHRSLLGSMCSLAQQIDGQAWLDTLRERVQGNPMLGSFAGRLLPASLQDQTIEEMLRLVGTSAAWLEHPHLEPVLGQRRAVWRGSEIETSLRFAQAQLVALLAVEGMGTLSADAIVARSQPVLTRAGEVWQSLGSLVQSEGLADPVWRITNTTGADRTLRLTINGDSLFDREALIEAVLRMPKLRPDEGLQLRAWRFLTKWRVRNTPITGGQFLHQVDLYLRSVGAGRCDDDASALRELWSMLGFEARVWALGGHIVPEVLVNGRWEMYDPHLVAYYRMRDGRVAGVEELERDPSLISQPVEYVSDPLGEAYEVGTATMYGNPAEKRVMGWYAQDPKEPMDSVFTVPAGGYLEIVAAATYAFPSLSWSLPLKEVATAQARIWFPPGYTGAAADLPLILADAQGSGTLTALGTELPITPAGIRPLLQQYYETDPDGGVTRIRVSDVGPGGLTLTLLVNRLYFATAANVLLAATAPDLAGMRLTRAPPAVSR